MYKQSLLPRNPSFKVLLWVAASNFGSVLHDISESLCPPTRSPQAHSCEHKKPIQLFQPSVFQWQPIRRKIASNKEGREQQLVWKEFEKSITLQLYMNSFTDNIFLKYIANMLRRYSSIGPLQSSDRGLWTAPCFYFNPDVKTLLSL